MLKKHLLEGVKKGAFDDAEATRRFNEWIKQQEEKIESKRSGLEKSQDDELGKRLAAEKKVNEERSARLLKRQQDLAAKAEAESQPEAAAEVTEESPAEASDEPAAEEKPQE